ncbi:MAG: UrcA family protein [Caulobacteraceae bacterium]
MKMRYALAALAAVTLAAGPALAHPAQDEDGPRQAAVSYADLNLDTASGQAVLVARIRRAAEAVCGGEPDSRDVKAQMTFRGCMKQTVGTAVAAIPSVSKLAGNMEKLALK